MNPSPLEEAQAASPAASAATSSSSTNTSNNPQTNTPQNDDPPAGQPTSLEELSSPQNLPPTQQWTVDDGCYPIVDGKYLNLETGQVATHTGGPSKLGPPNISVYWQNRFCTGASDQFLVVCKTICSTRSLSEYIVRIGNMLQGTVQVQGSKKNFVRINSLNATPYAVYVVCETDLSGDGFRGTMEEFGLLD